MAQHLATLVERILTDAEFQQRAFQHPKVVVEEYRLSETEADAVTQWLERLREATTGLPNLEDFQPTMGWV